MGDKTRIEWADSSWNPVTGCTKVSEGCDHCYAETIAYRFAGTAAYPDGFAVTLRPERLDQPLRWQRPRRIFVNSMSDLFHTSVPDVYIARVFAVMAQAEQHTFQVLTKRPGRMRSLLNSDAFMGLVEGVLGDALQVWPLPNVWLGTSLENQKWAQVRIPHLLDTRAAVRFLSCEPLLGPVSLTQWTKPHTPACLAGDIPWCTCGRDRDGYLDWVIVGGESGPNARAMDPRWARGLRDECVAAGVPFLFKQWGEWAPAYTTPRQGFSWPDGRFVEVVAQPAPHPLLGADRWSPAHADIPTVPGWIHLGRIGKKTAGRLLDGRTWDEYPEAAS